MSKSVGLCFTAKINAKANVLKTNVAVENRFDTSKKAGAVAIWDTGAMKSLITPELAKKLELKPFQMGQIYTPSGCASAEIYKVNLYLPNRVIIRELSVLSGIPSQCDMLIGMDVISAGDFVVTNFNNKTTFSFRIPSFAEIDFCQHSYMYPTVLPSKPKRNDLCPCGSGQKYKKCCGK